MNLKFIALLSGLFAGATPALAAADILASQVLKCEKERNLLPRLLAPRSSGTVSDP